jgi:hypothetical protein
MRKLHALSFILSYEFNSVHIDIYSQCHKSESFDLDKMSVSLFGSYWNSTNQLSSYQSVRRKLLHLPTLPATALLFPSQHAGHGFRDQLLRHSETESQSLLLTRSNSIYLYAFLFFATLIWSLNISLILPMSPICITESKVTSDYRGMYIFLSKNKKGNLMNYYRL